MKIVYSDYYSLIYRSSNLWTAYSQAARGKRYRAAAANFELNLEDNLLQLQEELLQQVYQPGAYHNFAIQKPKHRLISAAPFRDRVVHHALMNVIEPVFERKFIFDSYANRVSKGTHQALDRCTYFLRRNKYVMHCDVRQFFPSIDHAILKQILLQNIPDNAVMNLISRILASGEGVQAGEYNMVYHFGDDLLAILRPRGLPIGNLTSQHWANVYLNELDQYAKRILKTKAYIRYVDDMLFFSDDKHELADWRAAIITFLSTLRLTLHETKTQARPAVSGITFLGFQIFPDHRRLKPANGYAFQRRLKSMQGLVRQGKMSRQDLGQRIQSWNAHASYGNTYHLRCQLLGRELVDAYG